ncbi:Hypothetical predicted protein [Scomber scombrus]|uniref:Uncharacterized protein n=1 Tax=Scomber scombrus TaxID=13677 RepID=A0AAV1N8X3_SCOSC
MNVKMKLFIALPVKSQCPLPTPNISTQILPPLADRLCLDPVAVSSCLSVPLSPSVLPPNRVNVVCFAVNCPRNLLKKWDVKTVQVPPTTRTDSNQIIVVYVAKLERAGAREREESEPPIRHAHFYNRFFYDDQQLIAIISRLKGQVRVIEMSLSFHTVVMVLYVIMMAVSLCLSASETMRRGEHTQKHTMHVF